jgi:hypothetical protein
MALLPERGLISAQTQLTFGGLSIEQDEGRCNLPRRSGRAECLDVAQPFLSAHG